MFREAHREARRSRTAAQANVRGSLLSASWSDRIAAPCLRGWHGFSVLSCDRGRSRISFSGQGAATKTLRARSLACARAPDLARAAREVRKSMRPKKTILCVDHNEQSLAVRTFMLETRGYRVLSALSSQEALDIFRNGGIDLVLSDLVMPQMDGNELVRRMKDISPEVPTILVSATVKAFERANRADAFLPKGACTPVEVLDRIRLMVARKRGPKKAAAALVHNPAREAVFDGAARAA